MSSPVAGESADAPVILNATFVALDSFVDFQRQFGYVVNGWVTATLVFVGCLLNVVCIVIFLRPQRRSGRPVIYYYLICLAMWETTLLLNAFLMYSFPTLYYGHVRHYGPYVVIFPFVYTLSNMTLTGSVWVVIALTVDRYFALCHPLAHKVIQERKRVKKLLLLVSASAVLFSLPRYFELQVAYMHVEYLDGNYSVIMQTPLPLNQMYMVFYRIIGGLLFYSLVPSVLLFTLTVRITIELRRAIAKRRTMSYRHRQPTESPAVERCLKGVVKKKPKLPSSSSSESSQHAANIMLMAVIVKFLLSHLMPTALDVGEHIVGALMFQSSRYASFFIDISNLLIVFNSSTNFWIYLAFGRSFRTALKALFMCAPDVRDNPSGASSQRTVSRYDSKEGTLGRLGKNKNGQRSSCVAAMSNPSNPSNGSHSPQPNCLTVGSVVQWNNGRLRTLPRASIEVLI